MINIAFKNLGVAALIAVTMATSGIIPNNLVSAQEVENSHAVAESDAVYDSRVTFSQNVPGKEAKFMGSIPGSMSNYNGLRVTITSIIPTASLTFYISSNSGTSPDPFSMLENITGSDWGILQMPKNPAGKNLYGSNDSSWTAKVSGSFKGVNIK